MISTQPRTQTIAQCYTEQPKVRILIGRRVPFKSTTDPVEVIPLEPSPPPSVRPRPSASVRPSVAVVHAN